MRATACFIHDFGEKIHVVLAVREDLVADTCLLNKIEFQWANRDFQDPQTIRATFLFMYIS